MLKSIRVDSDIIEMMQFFWEGLASKQKVVDSYFIEIAEKPQMQVLYDEEFNRESVREVLSAIMNRERVNHPTKRESRFWSLNMWMLEDLDNMRNMLQPVKQLNIDELKSEYQGESKTEKLNVNFIPGCDETYFVEDGVLTVNFFKIMVDYEDPSVVKIDGKPLKEFVMEKAREVL